MTATPLPSPDAQATLLLCSDLGISGPQSTPPLTPSAFHRLLRTLADLGKTPKDFFDDYGALDETLVHDIVARDPRFEAPRLLRLLRHGAALGVALERWRQMGFWFVAYTDPDYPVRLKEHLASPTGRGESKAPPLLYCLGTPSLIDAGGIAFVGSRDLSPFAEEAIRQIVPQCVQLGHRIVSGCARGADQAAMRAGLDCGGEVIGAIPCWRARRRLAIDQFREGLETRRLLLLSAHDPDEDPFSYGRVAMERNAYIYALADAAFVAQSARSTPGKNSGTYEGAINELKHPAPRPLFVLRHPEPQDSPGGEDLLRLGAQEWKTNLSCQQNLDQPTPRAQTCQPPPSQQSLDLG